jgi:hypothetical protein
MRIKILILNFDHFEKLKMIIFFVSYFVVGVNLIHLMSF